MNSGGARLADVDHLNWLATLAPGGANLWANKTVLDLGCGSGFLCQEFRRQGAKVAVGIDLETPDVQAKDWLFMRQDLEAPGWEKGVRQSVQFDRFDLITAFDIIEHLSSPVKFLESCRDLLREGGHLVITTPNTASWERLLRPDRWSGSQDPQHKILFNRYSLDFLQRRTGFEPLVIKAPLRKLSFLKGLTPNIGAQIFSLSKKT